MRLIDADAVYKILESCEIRKATMGNPLTDWEHGYNCGIERAESEIECATTVDAVPVIHGKWITEECLPGVAVCSICGHEIRGIGCQYTKYCDECGARMDADETD